MLGVERVDAQVKARDGRAASTIPLVDPGNETRGDGLIAAEATNPELQRV